MGRNSLWLTFVIWIVVFLTRDIFSYNKLYVLYLIDRVQNVENRVLDCSSDLFLSFRGLKLWEIDWILIQGFINYYDGIFLGYKGTKVWKGVIGIARVCFDKSQAKIFSPPLYVIQCWDFRQIFSASRTNTPFIPLFRFWEGCQTTKNVAFQLK